MTAEQQCFASVHRTAWGQLGLAAKGEGLTCVILPRKSATAARRALQCRLKAQKESAGKAADEAAAKKALDKAAAQISEYFAGKRRSFDVPNAPQNATPFTRAVWRACSRIPYGQTRSYGWIAERIGRPRAVRAVGTALGANPLPLVIPCHRVIRRDGGLGGFGGGVGMKKRLLDLERRSS